MHATSRILLLALASFGALCSADVAYTVKPSPDKGTVEVKINFIANTSKTEMQMPEWMPGYYILEGYGQRVTGFSATAGGKELKADHPNRYTWAFPTSAGQKVTVSYQMPYDNEDGVGHYAGASTYMYVAGRKGEACTLALELPKNTRVAIGLEGTGLNYKAPNYDVLADNSATWGSFVEAKYTAAGKPHFVAIRGSGRKTIDAKKLAHECQMISEIQTDYFGGAPYSKYVWQVYSHEGPGPSYGIEHLTSTEIMMGTEVNTGISGLLAHEYLHLWNVKRIRSKALGPFDYTKLPKTGALWWLEGVTDYLTQSLQRRYGRTTDVEFFNDVAGNLAGLERSIGYKQVSPYECSARIGEAADGMGNSNGFGMSYYECGYLLGLVFDIELMERTGGKKSLDDVELALWKLCKDSKPGFEEGEIRNQLVLAGGASLGVLYDQLVMKPSKIPLASTLSKVGLRLTKDPSGRYSISAADAMTWKQIKLRNLWLAKKRNLK